MRKKFNSLRHMAILFLTIIIFLLGIFFGGAAEQLRINSLYNDLKIQNLEYQNLQTELSYLNFLLSQEKLNKTSCNLVKGSYFISIKNLDNARIRLEDYLNSAKIDKEDFYQLKDHYIVKRECGGVNTILYFYGSKKKCPACEDEGIHLTYVKDKLKDNVLIFALDTERDKGPIKLLMTKYDIYHRELPVLVINDKICGFKTNEQVFKILNESNINGTTSIK